VASASAVRIELDLHEARASGDPVLLGRLAANLVTNAAKYNEPGGLLRVQTRMEGGRATILVENDGPEVEPGAVPTLFSRFTRRAEAGEGHGLGLAIVDAIVTSHRGVLTAKARPEGGLRIEASLPST
jgi:signal transduction histidine kinase